MRRAALVRAIYGAILLVAPGKVIQTLTGERPPPDRAVLVGRVLGARQLLQALTVDRVRSPGWLLIGTLVDVVHAVSMVGLAAVADQRRWLPALDAVLAGTWAATGLRAARRERAQ